MSASSKFLQKYGPWAMVTGASSGIGEEFARQLAAIGLSLVLIARRKELLEVVASSVRENYPVQTKTIIADLSTTEGCEAAVSGSNAVDFGVVILNAGVMLHGSFFRDDINAHLNLISVNVSANTYLAHALARRLVEQEKGGIIFVSSISSSPFPWFSTYSASKSFLSSLALILREELRPRGVDVLALEPGIVKSDMSSKVNESVDFKKLGMSVMAVEDCVREGLEALLSGKRKITPGLMNKIILFLGRLIPNALYMRLMGFAMVGALKPEMRDFLRREQLVSF